MGLKWPFIVYQNTFALGTSGKMGENKVYDAFMCLRDIESKLSYKYRIIEILEKFESGLSYEELLTRSGMPEAMLRYHLRKMQESGVITKDAPYKITPIGKKAVEKLREVLKTKREFNFLT